jgi:hypothetical protein
MACLTPSTSQQRISRIAKAVFEPSKLAGGGLHCMFNLVLKTLHSPTKAINQFNWLAGMDLPPPDIREGVRFHSPLSLRERYLDLITPNHPS